MTFRSIVPALIVLNIVSNDGSPDTLDLHKFDRNIYPDAVCNDGSAAGFYYKSPPQMTTSSDSTCSEESDSCSVDSESEDPIYWLIHLKGGHWCWDKKSCYERSQHFYFRTLMSNKHWTPTISKTGIFDDDLTFNTNYTVNSHKIFVPYCSSDGWIGNSTQSDTNNELIYFKGQSIVITVLAELKRLFGFGVSGRDHLILSGCSAGGRGAMNTLDSLPSICSSLGIEVESIVGVLDSPLWIEMDPLDVDKTVSLAEQTNQLYHWVNAENLVMGTQCGARYQAREERWKCLFAEYKLETLQLPFVMNAAQYDSWQLGHNLGDNYKLESYGEKERKYAENPFRVKMRDFVMNQIENHVISTSCFHHCVTELDKFWNIWIDIEGEKQSFASVVQTFLDSVYHGVDGDDRPKNKFMDDCTGGIDCGESCDGCSFCKMIN